nr:ribonuclease E inhibitor RraB [Pseudoxanthomonas sp. PXM01]
MENRDVCAALEEQGDALRQPREIDHWASFPSATARDEFLQKAAMGFENRTPDRDDDGEREWGAQVFRHDVPAYGTIDAICLPLYDLAGECGGHYDGWECEVLAGAS